ncbi:MAG TPA: DUF2461 domain-containing protein [Vicinamibacteria bacterium]|nr:DUF2461 domain-containing protein [Vicinamibacteria bacterium]
MVATAPFTPDLFRFLGELKAHNERDWFQKNKARYERSVRDPFLRFIADLGPRLKKISPEFVADPSPVGGSMMRIYRDTRFSKDKTPYKVAVAARFSHAKGKEGATPAFYLRVQPGDCSVGAGIWRPEPNALKRIRQAIVGETKRWQRITQRHDSRSGCGMAGESLRRAPLGFDPNHPCLEDIKRKDFATRAPLDDRRVTSPRFTDDVLDAFQATAPFVEFLTEAIGLKF